MDHISSIRRRSSLFSINQASDSGSTSKDHAKYEKQLRLEIKQWTDLLREKCQKLRHSQKASCKIEQSVLSEKQQQYLADGPTVDSFILETESFDKAILAYVERKLFLMERNTHIVQEAKALVELELKDSVAMELLGNKFS
ncbi:uncharacterized protein LOC128724059 [Anopheles nili]|uniref:uncharacterized protein LOC128724059 n=1 Tax=Anopheles nili TaxID=185578 RepID=UPI00237B2692|nr:uncharacterized protein LOC128724059 [Anopheles nili]